MPLKDALCDDSLVIDMAEINLELVQTRSFAQIMIQLCAFAKKVRAASAAGAPRTTAAVRPTTSASSSVSTTPAARMGASSEIDFGDIFGTINPKDEGINATPWGIAKRVILLLSALVGFGVARWYLGLEYGFKTE